MSLLSRFVEKHEKKERKAKESESLEKERKSKETDSFERGMSSHRQEDDSARSPSPSKKTSDSDLVIAEADLCIAPHQTGKKRGLLSISRSGRYKSKNKTRTRIMSDEAYGGTSGSVVVVTPPTDVYNRIPAGGDNSSAKPSNGTGSYLILQSDSTVNYAIESTSL